MGTADYEFDNIFAKNQMVDIKWWTFFFAKSSDLNKIMCKGVLEVADYESDNVFAKKQNSRHKVAMIGGRSQGLICL